MPIKITRHNLLNQRYFFKEENSLQLFSNLMTQQIP